MAGVLEPGEHLGDITVPAGMCALGFQTPDQQFVWVEPREKLLEFLDECKQELLERKGWGNPRGVES